MGDAHEGTSWPDSRNLTCNVTRICVKCNLAIRGAMRRPDAKEWQSAITAEYDKLVSAGTWRDPTPEELSSVLQCIPVTVLLSQKRNGEYKSRAVALGNLYKRNGVDVFAPTLSMLSHRLMLVKAARDGDHFRAFDIEAAFLNAKLDVPLLIVFLWTCYLPAKSQ